MLGLSSFLTASTAVQSAIGRLLGALGGRSTYTENRKDSRDTIIDISKGDILDKASILLTPTSYSDGKMRSVKSEPTVTHSEDFTTNTTGAPWETSDPSVISHDSANNLLKVVYDDIEGNVFKRTSTLLDEAGAQYKVTFRARGTRATAFTAVGANNVDGAIKNEVLTYPLFQDYEFDITTDTYPTVLRLYLGSGSGGEYLEITDLLVQDTSSDFDFSRDSSAMRVGPDGLLQDMQDVVGESELILNGDFSDISSNILPNADFSDSSPASQAGLDGGLQFAEWAENAYDDGLKKFEAIEGGIRCTITKQFTDQTWHQRIYQYIGESGGILEVGKSFRFRAKFRCSVAQSNFKVAIETTYGNVDQISPEYHNLNAGEWVEADIYFRCTAINDPEGSSTNPDGPDRNMALIFCPDEKIPTGAFYEIKDLSIEKLDPNDRWTGSPSGEWAFNENGVISSDSATLISQLDVLDEAAGVSDTDVFKATFTAKLISGDGGLDVYIGVNNANSVTTTATATEFVVYDNKAPSTGTSTTQFYFYNTGGGVIEISNVSVKNITLTDDLDIPRISYDKDGLNGHILLEPARTNQIKRSEDFRASPWGSTGSPTISAPSEAGTLAPDGTYTATKFTSADATSAQFAYHSALTVEDVGSTSTTYYTTSVFAKKIDYDYMYLWFTAADSAFVGGGAWFNISNGTLGTLSSGVTASIEDFGNGWYRCSATKLPVDDYNSNGGQIRVALANADNTQNVVGDGSKATYFWGAQFEEGAYQTSYIPTHAGSSVTRSAETMTGSGNTSLIDSENGTLYTEIAFVKDCDHQVSISVSESSSNRFLLYQTAGDNIILQAKKGGAGSEYIIVKTRTTSTDHDGDPYPLIYDYNKVAFKWEPNVIKLYVNGVFEDAFDTGSATTNVDFDADLLTSIDFTAHTGSTSNPFVGKVKCLAYFNDALTDDEMEALTGDGYNNFGELATANGYTVQ